MAAPTIDLVPVIRRFQREPDWWCEQTLGDSLWTKQREILRALADHEKVAVASCHGIGKTWLASRAALWFLHSFCPAIVATTAPTAHQVRNLLWKEIRTAHGRLPEELRDLSRCLTTELQFLTDDGSAVRPDHLAWGRSTDDQSQFQGVHGPYLMAIVDEAAGVADEIYEALDTWAAGGVYRELLIGNPTSAEGKFYRAFNNPELNYHCIRVAVHDTPMWSGEDVPDRVRRLLIQPARVAEWAADWGEESPAFKSRVLAQFPEGDATSILIPLGWIEACVAREPRAEPGAQVQIGVDVARFGDDRTCIACRQGSTLYRLRSWTQKDTVEVIALVRAEAQEALTRERSGPVVVNIDAGATGAAVFDVLKRDRTTDVQYRAIAFGGGAQESDRFVCARDELMWGLRVLAQTGNNDPDLAISAPERAEVERLKAQVSATRYEYNARAKVKIESKDEMKSRGMPSPDEADAAALAFYRPNVRRTTIRRVR